MVVLYIFISLVLLIAILLLFSVTADIKYNGNFSVKAKYLFITLYDSKKTKPEKKKPKKKDKKDKKKNKNKIKLLNNEKTKSKNKTFGEKVAEDSGIGAIAEDVKKGNKLGFDFEMFKLIYDSVKYPVKRLIRKLRVVNFRLNCVIGGEDAAKVALNYGVQSAVISGGLSWLDEIITLKVKEANITADFTKEQTELQMKCRVKLRLMSAAVFLVRYMLNTVRNNKK
ncbi:MAG: hypothetical protein FWH07_05010 [Oscillospiraceae bacterium]|nr:hypothetical protein [Oscillospiraceae bacterium]